MTRSIRTLLAAALAAGVALPGVSRAEMMRGGPLLGPPTFMQHVYSPRLVMRNQKTLGLTEDQRRAITRAIAEARKTLAGLEWKRAGAAEALGTLLAGPRIDEEAALARATELMATEQDIKRTHLRLLVRVKNQLTPEQQTTLDGLRERRRAERPWRRGDGPPARRPPAQ